MSFKITKKEINRMSWKSAIEILMDGTKHHLTGAGCGDVHHIPTGQAKRMFEIAYEKAFKHLNGYYSGNIE